MSLLTQSMEECVMLDKVTEPDGYGGFIVVYREGAPFKSAITFNTSMEARRAGKEGVTSLYTVTTPRNITLSFDMVFRRARDGKVFRVTSDGDDVFTPKTAGLDMRQVTAEEFFIDLGSGGGGGNG